MNRLFCLFVVVVMVLSTVSGQTLVNQNVTGPCSRFEVNNQKVFLPVYMIGTWHVYATYDNADIKGLDCLSTSFTFNLLTGNMGTTETGQNLKTKTRKEIVSTYHFFQRLAGVYSLNGADADAEKIQIPVTDYMNYFIEFSCTDLPDGQADCYVGVFTRLAIPSPDVVKQINNYLDAHHIDRTKLRVVNHDDAKCSPESKFYFK